MLSLRMPKAHLTDISVRNLKAPETGQIMYWAEDPSGFGVRVSQGGAKTFLLMHGRNRQRVTIGRYPTISLSQARAEAKRLLAEVTLGKSLARSVTFETGVVTFLQSAKRRNKPRTVADYERLLNRHFMPRFRKEQIGNISARDIMKRLDRLSDTPSEQQHALAAIRVFFNFTARQHMIEHSPCAAMRPLTRATTRDRVLDERELALIWNAAVRTDYPFGQIVQLLILTGQRRGEIAALKWDWIDRDKKTIALPANLTKNKRHHLLPYAEQVETVLGSMPQLGEYLFPARFEVKQGKPATVFNGWGKCKARLDQLVELENNGVALIPWTLHDLRRTTATGLAKLDTPPHVIERILNHVSGSFAGVAGVYNRHRYLDEMRIAVQKWNDFIRKN